MESSLHLPTLVNACTYVGNKVLEGPVIPQQVTSKDLGNNYLIKV